VSAVEPRALSLDERLGLDRYETDRERCHIQVDVSRCLDCVVRPCLTV
jgi:ferredoxin-like protein FixX